MNRPNQRWRYQFDRYIAGNRVRASRLLPKGWPRSKADEFDQKETARLYALATSVGGAEYSIDDAVNTYVTERLPHLWARRSPHS